MNSPPLSWTYLIGQGYLQSQVCENLSLIWAAVLLSVLTSSTKFKLDAVSMHVSALNSQTLLPTMTFQGPIKSMATSSQGATRTSRSGNKPYNVFQLTYAFGILHIQAS